PKTGTWDAIEGEVEHQETVLQQNFRKRAEMALGIGIADAEVGFGLHSERVGEEIVGAKQDIFLETFDVDLAEVGMGNGALAKRRSQGADGPRGGLLVGRGLETSSPLRVHRAGGGIFRVEMEHPFLVGPPRRDAMVMSIRRVAGAFPQLIDGFLDGVESMHDEIIAEAVPGWTLAALNADVDEHEGLTQNACLHYPVGELDIGIAKQIQKLLLPSGRGPPLGCVPGAARGRYFHSDDQEGVDAEALFSNASVRPWDARSRSFMERSRRRAGTGRF